MKHINFKTSDASQEELCTTGKELIWSGGDKGYTTRPLPLMVWVRLIPQIDHGGGDFSPTITLAAALHIVVYPTKEAADRDAEKAGGVVLQVVAAKSQG